MIRNKGTGASFEIFEKFNVVILPTKQNKERPRRAAPVSEHSEEFFSKHHPVAINRQGDRKNFFLICL